MKKLLLLVGITVAMATGTYAHAQFIYMDTNGDGLPSCFGGGTYDILYSSVTTVDIWLNTNHNADGSTASCSAQTGQPLDMFSYSLLFRSFGSGSVAYDGWTNAASGFAATTPFTHAGTDAGTDWTSQGAIFAPGLYKLGSISVTVTGTPGLRFLTDNTESPGISTVLTGFGSTCDGTTYPNTVALGVDFYDNCGTITATPTEATTWGKIKQVYR